MSLKTQFATSPRVSFEDVETGLTLQEVVNELRVIESSWEGMSKPALLDAEGKANLGGGLLTGITYTGKDGQIAFESVRTPVETGTITTPSTVTVNRSGFDSLRLIDVTALFIDANVITGSFVLNWTDRSIATVLQVISQIELVVEVPEQGSDNQFGSGDVYSVFNITVRTLNIGNAVAVDSLDAPLPAVLGTFGTFVTLEKATSAALVESGVSGLTPTESTALLLISELMEADQVFDQTAGLLHYFRKGTTTDLIPPKTVITQQDQDTSLVE